MATPETAIRATDSERDAFLRGEETPRPYNSDKQSDSDKQDFHQPNTKPSSPKVNVNGKERLVSSVSGGAITAYGISKGGVIGYSLAAIGAGLFYRGVSGNCSFYKAAGINTTEKTDATSVKAGAGVKIEKSLTINETPQKLYEFWRKFEYLPLFMEHLESVTETGADKSHWKAKAPLGYSVEWDAEIIADIPNELISWRSLENSDIPNSGSVRFKSLNNGRGTMVKVSLSYEPPAGKIGAALAWLFGEEPSIQVADDLRRFKNLMETDEIPTINSQPMGGK